MNRDALVTVWTGPTARKIDSASPPARDLAVALLSTWLHNALPVEKDLGVEGKHAGRPLAVIANRLGLVLRYTPRFALSDG